MLSVAVQVLGFAGIIFALLTIRYEVRRLRRVDLRGFQKMFQDRPVLVYITNSAEPQTCSAEPKIDSAQPKTSPILRS